MSLSHIARWKVGKCWEENRAVAALSCAIARLLGARLLEGWSGCCCCSPGLAMARLLDFSHPASTLSTLQLDLTAVSPGILIGTWVWQGSKKVVKLHFLSSWFRSDTLRECCTPVLGQHWLCPGHSFNNRALNHVVCFEADQLRARGREKLNWNLSKHLNAVWGCLRQRLASTI